MIELKSVSKPVSPYERFEAAAPKRVTCGRAGSANPEASRSFKHLVVKGKGGPIRPPGCTSAFGVPVEG